MRFGLEEFVIVFLILAILFVAYFVVTDQPLFPRPERSSPYIIELPPITTGPPPGSQDPQEPENSP